MERGWFQSKRSRVVNLPRVARRVRAARLRPSRSRRSISTSFSQVSRGPRRVCVACSKKERSAANETRQPSWCNWVAMSSLGIVASEIVRDDVAIGDVVAQRDVNRDGMFCRAPVLLAQHAHFARVVGAAVDGFCDGLLEYVRAVQVEQAAGLCHHAADVATRLDPALDEDVDARSGGAESITTSGRSSAALATHDLRTMIGMLDLLAVTPGTSMVGDDVGAVEQAD